MKNLLIILTIAIAANSAIASNNAWDCVIVDRRNEPVVASLNLDGYLSEIGVLVISDRSCKKVGPMIYSDFCILNKNFSVGIEGTSARFH